MTTPTQLTPSEAITAALRTADGLSDRQVRLAVAHLLTDLSLHCRTAAMLSREEVAAAVERAVRHAQEVRV